MEAQTSEQAIPRLRDKLRTYFHNSTTYLGLTLVACNATALTYYFGATLAAVWMVVAAAGLLGVVYLTVKSFSGDQTAHRRSIVVNCLTIAAWMAGAIGLWSTGEPAAWVLAILCCSSWTMHIIFMGQRAKLHTTLGVLAIATVPLLGFMLLSAWTSFPAWVALPTSIASFAMIASIGASAQISSQNFKALQRAMSDAAATKARLEFAIQSAGDGYFEIDLETSTYMPNPALAKMLTFEPGQKNMEDFRDQVHPDDADGTMEQLVAVFEGTSTGWKQEFRLRTPSGFSWMQLRAQVLEANAAHGRKLIGTLVDLTAWKAIESELRAAKETAEASSNAKSQFLANMSHEIRTPLNGVLGMAQALDGDELESAQKEKVAIILDSGKSLMALLNDVLDLTKIEAGKLEISPVPGDFLHTMKRTRQLFQAQAEDKGLELLVRYDSNFPQRLAYDPVRVRQCIGNLLSNAIKFTAKGRVEVAISAKASGAGQHMVSVEISDTGIGMSPETVGKLFSVFTQADGATTRKFGGSGLGLAISRQLARMMGGDLVVDSREGKGSTFRLTFKAQEAAPAAATETVAAKRSGGDASKRSLRGMRVLLTDDNAINRQVIKLFLAPQGCDIVEATNGKEALDKVSSGDFDVMLLDIHMPVMDGKEAIQRLRAANQPWSKMPVIALTADAMSGDREKYLALGMTDYVSKPVDQRELVAKMYHVLKLEAPDVATDATPGAKTGT